jgi:hypothetical protein
VRASSTGYQTTGSPRRLGRNVLVVVPAVITHPSIWWAALRALSRLARRGWWRRSPFLPMPGEAYLDFRLVTAYGATGKKAVISGDDVVAYLQWCRRTYPRRG